MSFHWRETIKGTLPAILGVVAILGGFVLLRLSAVFESWLLMFASFALMIWGLVMLFTGSWRPSGELLRHE